MSGHPSFLQLDRLASGIADTAVAAHARHCPECTAHLGRCEQPVAIPAWVRELPAPRKPGFWRRWAALGVLVTASLLIAVLPRSHEEVTAKGTPAVAVYFRRGERVALWDGVQPLQAGDAVQLKVQTSGYSRVTVGSIESGKVQTLYEGAAQADAATLLPQAFTLDDGTRDEALLVVFSRQPLSAEELRAARESLQRDGRLWTTVLDLTKKASR
jgi:hypothetical protein